MFSIRTLLIIVLFCLGIQPQQRAFAQTSRTYFGEGYLSNGIERLPPVPPELEALEPPPNQILPLPERPALAPSRGSGQEGMGPPGPGGSKVPNVQFYWLPQRDLKSSPGTMEIIGGDISFGMPVARSETTGMWILNGSWGQDHFETNARLDSLGRDFPEELTKLKLGLMNFRSLDNGWSVGGMVNVESASDRPFASIDEVNANLLAFVKVPSGERNAWNFSLMYSPLGQLPFPIPGVSYHWHPTDRFQANIGIPFSLNYQPTDAVQISLAYLPLTTVNAQIKWSITESFALYTGYSTHSEGFLLADRLDKQQRLFEFDQRIVTGARFNLGEKFVLDLSAGYIFDQSFFLSDSFFGGGRQDEIDVEPGLYAGIRLEFKPF